MIGSEASLGFRRRRGQRRRFWMLFRFFLGILPVALVGGYGYQVGVAANQAWTGKLEEDVERYQDDNRALRDRLAALALTASHAESALEALEDRFRAEVPAGALAELMARVDRQLRAGADRERLALLIDAAGQAQKCADDPETRRFRPQTELATGPVGAVRFGDRITVTATGESATDGDGRLEAWFDPAKPVRFVFQTLDGRALEVAGTLPLRHSMLVDGQEYRFSVIAGPTSFVEITGQVCPLA